jgi:hypothetical protein
MKDLQAFPASAAPSLVTGYCADFVELAANMAQTLEQVTMRGLDLGGSEADLARVERGMRDLADAIGEALRKAAAHPSARGATAGSQGATAPAQAAKPGLVGGGPAGRTKPAAASAGPQGTATPRPRGAAVPPTTTTLQGSTETLPMRSVFQFLSRTRKTGLLHVTLDQERVRFEFRDGRIVGTSSTQGPVHESLGAVLVELGHCAPTDVQPLVRQHGDGRHRLGSALLQQGKISREQLAAAVEQQTQRRLQRILTQQRAAYEFHSENGRKTAGQPAASARS